jgi:hypothetical protein
VNSTEPVTAVTAGLTGATVAVKVTVCPAVEGFRLEAIATVAEPLFTTCEPLAALAIKLVSPE